MPTLEWIGKSKVINHHQDVPFRVLERKYSFDENGQHNEDNGSENMIIRGDNLEALKALLPRYEGRVKCIYIDPPYNTGNEGWVYNDNVNDPKIKKWLGEVVGKEGEDLTRHDKWLCMMYPRLKLLQKLLADDGVIFISIDEIEHRYLELVMDEIFGSANRIDTFVWQNNYGGGAKSNYVVHLHEYVLCFAKNISTVGKIELPPDDNILKYYKYKDEKFDTRGPYRLQPLATTSMDDRPNLRYPLFYEGHEVWPAKQWFWSKERALEAQANDELVFSEKNGKWTVNYKQYLNGADSICVIDGQHRIFAHYESGIPSKQERTIAELRKQLHLLVTGLIFPKDMPPEERARIQSEIFLDINSNAKLVPQNVLLQIKRINNPIADESIAQFVVEQLNKQGVFQNLLQLSTLDNGKIKTASIVKFALRYLVTVTPAEGKQSLFNYWDGDKNALLAMDGNAIEEYVKFCVSTLRNYFGAIKKNLRRQWDDTDSKLLSVISINGFIIALTRQLSVNGVNDFAFYDRIFNGWTIDFSKDGFKYTSSQYRKFSTQILREVFQISDEIIATI